MKYDFLLSNNHIQSLGLANLLNLLNNVVVIQTAILMVYGENMPISDLGLVSNESYEKFSIQSRKGILQKITEAVDRDNTKYGFFQIGNF